MIHCSNPLCQEPNPLDQPSCHSCGRPLTHRYLWAIGDWIKCYQVGEILEERYRLIAPRIVLDLQPDLATYSPTDIPPSILPYLQLFPYRRHLPQIHSYIPSQDERLNLDIWLLDYGSLPLDERGQLRYLQLLPAIADCWFQVSARQQLQWLWQIASLWEPLSQHRVVSSLLAPSLLRINGTAVQLLELKPDLPDLVESSAEWGLPQLGDLWSSWIEGADPIIVPFLQSLCRDLRSQTLAHPPTLLSLLETAIATLHQSYTQRYRLFSATDIGLLRDHNEDACYPLTESTWEVNAPNPLLTMVCDGVGGQEGGEIAAHLAIETLASAIESHLQAAKSPTQSPTASPTQSPTQSPTASPTQSPTASPAQSPSTSPPDLSLFLNQAILKTNDHIYQRNNSEARQERQRMGTTLVLSLLQGHKAYFAHVGDSRIYWITPHSCQQVTVDDDWASKEVRLGYSFYRDAIQYPKAGALVQALGISESLLLTPSLQASILDENCVILLCSDGLSDYDRVEQYGHSLIAPILAGTTDVATVGQQLIALANELNGHDNITLALIHCQAWLPPNQTLASLDYEQIFAALSYPPTTDNSPSSSTAAFPIADPSPVQADGSSNNGSSSNESSSNESSSNIPRNKKTAWLFAIALSLIVAAIAGIVHLLQPAPFPSNSAPLSPPNDSQNPR